MSQKNAGENAWVVLTATQIQHTVVLKFGLLLVAVPGSENFRLTEAKTLNPAHISQLKASPTSTEKVPTHEWYDLYNVTI